MRNLKIIAILLFGLLTILLLFKGPALGFFERKPDLRLISGSAEGIRVGTGIRFRGLKIGDVTRVISPPPEAPDGNFIFEIDLDRAYEGRHFDQVAYLTMSLMGNHVNVSLLPSEGTRFPVQELRLETAIDSMESIKKQLVKEYAEDRERVKELFQKQVALLKDMADSTGSVQTGLKAFQEAAVSLNAATTEMREFFNEDRRKELAATLADLRAVSAGLKVLSDEDKTGTSAIERWKSAIASLESAAQKLNRILADLGEVTDRETRRTGVQDLRLILKHWEEITRRLEEGEGGFIGRAIVGKPDEKTPATPPPHKRKVKPSR